MYNGNRQKEFCHLFRRQLGTTITAKFWICVHFTAEKWKPFTAKTVPPYCIAAEKVPSCSGFTASAEVVTAEKW